MGSCLIVGGGLAGVFLAARLVEKGQSVTLVNKPDANSSSQVAGGIFHTVTGKRAARTYLADELTDALFAFFEQPGYGVLKKHLHLWPVYRPFPNAFLYNEWSAKLALAEYRNAVTIENLPYRPDFVRNEMGGLLVHRSGQLEVSPFLAELQTLLAQTERFRRIDGFLPYENIDAENGTALLPNNERQTFHSIIFCEGILANHNPFWLPHELWALKGQLITVEFEQDPLLDRIVIQGVFLTPPNATTGGYLAGSTYEREFVTEEPTFGGLTELLDKLDVLTCRVFEKNILEHYAGIRPTTPDRRPLLGRHPQLPKLFFFNGLGAKGVLLAPYFSEMMAAYLVGQRTDLPKDVQWLRLPRNP